MNTETPEDVAASLKHNGRTLAIQVLVNTDEDFEVVTARVRMAAEYGALSLSQEPPLTIVTGGVANIEGESARVLWLNTLRALQQAGS